MCKVVNDFHDYWCLVTAFRRGHPKALVAIRTMAGGVERPALEARKFLDHEGVNNAS
jgi:hypothetical protein